MTSSGRRVKRRNLDGEESSLRNNRSRKSRFGQHSSKKKSSQSKSSRPRRAAARNALSFLSRISGRVSEGEGEGEEDDIPEGDSFESYSSQQETEAGSEETEVSSENEEENGHLKGKEIAASEDVSTHHDTTPKRRLVFKLPNRDSSKRELVGPSSSSPHEIDESTKNFSLINGNGKLLERNENGLPMKSINHVSLLEGNIRWGGAKSRSLKRSRITEPIPSVSKSGDESCPDVGFKIENDVHENMTFGKEFVGPSDAQIQKGKMVNLQEEQANNQDKVAAIPLQTKLQKTPTKLKIRSSIQDLRNSEGTMLSDGSTSDVPDPKVPEMPLDATNNTLISHIQPNSRDKMFKEVYRRSKSTRSKSTSVGTSSGGMEASTSNADNINQDARTEARIHGTRRNVNLRVISSSNADNTNQDERIEARIHGTRRNVNLRVIHDISEDTSSKEEKSSSDELPQEEDRLNSRHNVGLRSTRSRRAIDYNRKNKSPEKRKPHQSTRNSWLLLSTHEEGSRYIPQLGDEVVYFRQV